ncbi:MAG: hypothetical protein JKX73_01165 [Flavobacteriales bacterium]|nr:hypothetical protein [Flavobacteriales bacterium]
MKLEVGNKVSFLSEVGEGEVVSIPDETTVIVMVDGFEQTYDQKDVILIDPKEREEFTKQVNRLDFTPSVSEPQEEYVSKKNPRKSDLRPSHEINLHMEDLRDEYADLGAGEKLQMQLRYFSEKLEEAIAKRQKNLIVIHGVGKGTLRAEVRLILDDYSGLTYSDASYEIYGYGATEVFIQ